MTDEQKKNLTENGHRINFWLSDAVWNRLQHWIRARSVKEPYNHSRFIREAVLEKMERDTP